MPVPLTSFATAFILGREPIVKTSVRPPAAVASFADAHDWVVKPTAAVAVQAHKELSEKERQDLIDLVFPNGPIRTHDAPTEPANQEKPAGSDVELTRNVSHTTPIKEEGNIPAASPREMVAPSPAPSQVGAPSTAVEVGVEQRNQSKPTLWVLAAADGTVYQDTDRPNLERWVAYRNAELSRYQQVQTQYYQPMGWRAYAGFGGCAGGSCR